MYDSHPQAFWLWRNLHRNVMLNSALQTSDVWVQHAYRWFQSFCTAHMTRERERERERKQEQERESTEGIPRGLLFCRCALNAYSNSCRHKCVMLGKPATKHQTSQKPISSAFQQGTENSLCTSIELVLGFFFFFLILHFWRFKFQTLFDGLDQTCMRCSSGDIWTALKTLSM